MLIKWFVRSVWNFAMCVTNVYRRCATVLEKNQARCPVIWKCVPNVGMLNTIVCTYTQLSQNIRHDTRQFKMRTLFLLISLVVLDRSVSKFQRRQSNLTRSHTTAPEDQAWCAAIQKAKIIYPHNLSCTWPIGLKLSPKTKQINRKSYNCSRGSGMIRGNSKCGLLFNCLPS